MEVIFDPRLISYEELLDVYWNSFPVTLPPGPSRVRTAIITRGASQLEAAKASKRRLQREIGDRVSVEILSEAAFWPAERMHQKFHLQRIHPELVRDLAESAGTDVDTFLTSRAAGQLNAFLTGFVEASVLADVAAELNWNVGELESRLMSRDDPGSGSSVRIP